MPDWRYAEQITTLPSLPLGLTHLLPDEPGIYIAVVWNDLGDCFVGYVGIATQSLYQRWNSHRGRQGKAHALANLALRTSMNERMSYVRVHYSAQIPSTLLREEEEEIIAIWNPPLNAPRWGEGNSPLLTTLPPGFGSFRNGRGNVWVTPFLSAAFHIDCHAIALDLKKRAGK